MLNKPLTLLALALVFTAACGDSPTAPTPPAEPGPHPLPWDVYCAIDFDPEYCPEGGLTR